MRFNDTNRLSLPNIMASATAGEIIAVLKVGDKTTVVYPSANDLWYIGGGVTSYYSSVAGELNYRDDDGFGLYRDYNPFGPLTDPTAIGQTPKSLVSNFHIHDTSAGGSLWVERYHGTRYHIQNLSGNVFVLFNSEPEIGDGFVGDMAEIIIYDHVLSNSERTLVKNYLATKYGLAAVDLVPPTPPTNLTASDLTDSSFTLTWTPATDNIAISTYDVYLSGVLIGSTSDPSFNISGLHPATSYSVTVQARDTGDNESAPSVALNVSTLSDETAPWVPTGVILSGATFNTLTLTWADSMDNVGVVAYDVYHDGILIGSSTAPTFTVTGLNPGVYYSIQVRARDAVGNASGLSEVASFTTLSDTSAPTVPNGLAASALTTNSFNLTWTGSTDNYRVVGYDVYRDGSLIGSTTSPNFTVTGLSAAKSYVMTVRAYDFSGNVSALSSPLTVMTPALPLPVIVDTDGDGLPNPWEIAYGLNPNLSDNMGDLDGDGIPNNQDARPNQASISILSVTITAPTSGSVQ